MLDKNDRLRRRYLKPLAATYVAAHQHIVHANHVVAGFGKLGPILLVAGVDVLFLGPLEPANIVIGPLAAMRARKARLFDLLPLIKYIAFVHSPSLAEIWPPTTRIKQIRKFLIRSIRVIGG